MIPTKHIDLGDGDSAELYVELLHGTSRRVQDVYRPYLMQPEIKKALETVTEDQRIAKLFELIGGLVDVTGAADLLLLGQVASWTFGPRNESGPLTITQEVLDLIPERKRELLIQEANALYGAIPLHPSGAGK